MLNVDYVVINELTKFKWKRTQLNNYFTYMLKIQENITISSKSFIVCVIHFFVQNWKNIFFLYCMCEPLLFVKDDNYVDKEYEEANEWNVAARRRGGTF